MADKKTHLEEALEFLINEETEHAVESFHNFIVSSARSIHESLMEDDEIDDEINEDSSDEEVTEAKDDDSEEVTEAKDDDSDDSEEVTEAKDDDDDKEPVEEGMNEYFGGSDLGEAGEEDFGSEMGTDELGGELGAEEGGETVTVDASDLIDLQAKFDTIMADTGLGGEEELGADEFGGELGMDDGGEGDIEENRFAPEANPFAEGNENDEEAVEEAVSHGDGVQATAGTDAKGEGNHGKHASIAHNADVGKNDDSKLSEAEVFDFDLTEEDFLDLEEGLKAVSVSMGGEQGGVKFAGEETNTKSTVADKDKSDVNAKPTDGVSKQKEHNTYKRESAPSNDKLPHSGENNHDKAEGTPGRSAVAGHGGLDSNSGNGGEQGKKKFAGTETNTKSTIGSNGSRTEK